MAHEGSPVHVSSPSQEPGFTVKDPGDDCQQELWYTESNDIIDAGGPSSVEVQPDLSGSPRSISASSQLDDFNGSLSPSNPLAETEGGGDLDIMGIANSWNDDEAFCNESAIPARGVELSCLGQTASSGPWTSPTPLFPTTLDLFEDDRESVCELLGDVADSNSIPGVCGLRNLGNTCFMNAGLQCLINTPPLLNYFHSNSIDDQYIGCNSVHLTAQFAAFLLKMWSGRFSTLRPAEFKHTLSLYHPQFKDYRQHDCQEFLALLLDSLHEHLSQTTLKEGTSNHTRAIVPGTGTGRDADLPADCCLLTEEPMELYESSRSSQLSSPRSSSDSVETSSSCTTSCSSTRAKAAALSLRSLPIPEEVKQPLFPLTIHPPSQDGSVTDLLFKGSSLSPQKCSLVMERNMLNPCVDPVQNIVLEKNLLSEISSMMKESKTANVNISTGSAETSPNNEICFDSGKFPPTDQAKPRAAVASTLVRNTEHSAQVLMQTQQHLMQKNKVKNTNMLKETAKRLSEDQNLSSSFPLSLAEATSCSEQSLPSPNNENVSSISKKARLENDEGQDPLATGQVNDNRGTSPWDSLGALSKAVREEESSRSDNGVCMTNSIANESVVTHTFQGQFRSTVVCCSCKHVSVTYEPFMYLSVPLPRALERQIEVVYIPASGANASSAHQLLLQQYDEVLKLRQMLVKRLGLDQEQSSRLVLAEVANRVIVRFLEDQMLLRNLTDGQPRSVYAFAVPPPSPSLTPVGLSGSDDACSSSTSVSADITQSNDSAESNLPPPMIENSWKSCAICLEEMADSKLRKHTSCTCLLCQSCIEASCRHHRSSFGGGSRLGDYLQCPVCGMDVKPEEEFAPLDKLHCYRPVIRLLNLPILFRLASNLRSANPKSSRLIGHPRLLQLPNLVSPRSLYDTVKNLYPKVNAFDLCFVDQQGVRCPRCVYPNRCSGCKISPDADQISFQPGDCLAVQVYPPDDEDIEFEVTKWDKVFELQTVAEQDDCVSSSCSSSRIQKEPLTLDDCLSAFSESETLDEGNPWFCPKCQKSQCASKTLSICQAPPYLIVYLKRFVFHDNSSNKLDNRVEFPLTGLCLQPYVDNGEVSNNSEDYMYDLYGVVCHFGSASSGHYTAYTRHVNSKDWHYYNDETVLSRAPQDEDFSHGYVLFYQRRSRQDCHDETLVPCVMDKQN